MYHQSALLTGCASRVYMICNKWTQTCKRNPLVWSYRNCMPFFFSFLCVLKTIQSWSAILADLEGDYLYRWEGQHRAGESGGRGYWCSHPPLIHHLLPGAWGICCQWGVGPHVLISVKNRTRFKLLYCWTDIYILEAPVRITIRLVLILVVIRGQEGVCCAVMKFILKCSFISVTVSVLSIEGTDCRLDELGRLADRTGGKVRDDSKLWCVIMSVSMFMMYVTHQILLSLCVLSPRWW